MDKIIYYYHHFKLRVSLITFIVCMVLNLIVTNHLQDSYNPIGLNNSMLILPFRFILLIVWIASIVLPIMMIHYSDATGGRDAIADMRHYNRTYWDNIRYFCDADPYRMQLQDLPIGDWRQSEGIILGKKDNRIIKRSSEENGGDGANLACFGLPGSGKTASILIPTALRYGGSILAIDIKGDILARTKDSRKIKIFAPDDPSVSCHYNPLAGIENMTLTERRSFIEMMAAVLVQDEKDGKYFVEGARDFFCGIALYMLNQDINTSLPSIAKAILQGNGIDWIYRIKDGNCPEAAEYTNAYYGSNEKNVAGAYGGIAKAVRPFAIGGLAELLTDNNNCLSPATLNQGYDIYVEIPQDKIKLYSPISTILVQNFMTEFMRRPDKSSGIQLQPVLFMLDEFPQLHFDFDTLSSAMSTLRSKRVSIFVAQQSVAQLTTRYGESSCREIIDTCSYIAILSAQDPTSRKFFQDLLGSRKVLKMTSSGGDGGLLDRGTYSRGAQEVLEPIFRTEDFANLDDKLIIYAKGKYIVADKTYWFK